MLQLRKLLLISILFSPSLWAMGDPVTLNIRGRVIAAACQVSSDSVTKTVDLTAGHVVTASSMYTAGSTSPWVNFDLSVEQCPEGTTSVAIQFNGNPDNEHPDDMYQNLGTATPLAVQVQGSDGQPLGNGKLLTGIIANQRYTWNLRARLFSQQGQVTTGTVNSVVTVSMIYQ